LTFRSYCSTGNSVQTLMLSWKDNNLEEETIESLGNG